MAAEKSMMQPTTQAAIKDAKEVIMAVTEADNPVNAAILVWAMHRTVSPALNQHSTGKQKTDTKDYKTLSYM